MQPEPEPTAFRSTFEDRMKERVARFSFEDAAPLFDSSGGDTDARGWSAVVTLCVSSSQKKTLPRKIKKILKKKWKRCSHFLLLLPWHLLAAIVFVVVNMQH